MKPIIHLTPPCLLPENIKEKITCIRWHRERIFNVSTQINNSKLIVHNYGHGGAGWTFLFGCVPESIRQFEQQLRAHTEFKQQPITVVGAGCYGLLTALMLKQKRYNVQIIAQKSDDINSYKAAGFFFPRPRKSSTQQEIAIFHALGMESFKAYQAIAAGTHAFIKQGARIMPAYFGLDIDPGFGPYIAASLMPSPSQVTISFGNKKEYQVMHYQTIFIDTLPLMAELHRNLKELAIPIIYSHITSWDDLEQPIIFNCSGAGAKTLTSDPRIIPVQGHLITLQQQPRKEELQYMINVKVVMRDLHGRLRDELIYFAPKEEGILGITFIRGQSSLTANQHEFDRLLERSRDFFGK